MKIIKTLPKILALAWNNVLFRNGSSWKKRSRKIAQPVHNARRQVVVLTQFYAPEPYQLPPEIAAAFSDAGYEVSVITGYPNRPGGEIYSGYRQQRSFAEVLNGVEVHRAPLIINHSRKALERVLNYISFSLSALRYTEQIREADAVYVYATPATAAIPAQIWKAIFGIPYVLHVQDLWPESVTDSGMMGKGIINRTAEKLMRPWLNRLYGGADALIAISPGMKTLLTERNYDAGKSHVVYNWAHEDSIVVKPSESFGGPNVSFLYAGNLGHMQDLETVIAAAVQLGYRSDFSLKFAGSGIMENHLRTAAAGQDHIEFLGMLSRPEISEIYLGTDFQLVTLKDLQIFRTTIPSKLQASLAAGVPVITTVRGDVAALIEGYEAGIVAEPENADSLVGAFETALNMSSEERARMGRNARRLYEEQMSQATGQSQIVSVVDALLDRVTSKPLL